MAATQPRDRLVANLRTFANADIAAIERLQNLCVVCEYFSRPNHRGGVVAPMANPEKRTLSNGKTVAWKDVPLARALEHAESFVKDHVEYMRRSMVWDRLFICLPVRKYTASWDKPIPNPNEHPATPYSAYRATEKKSNLHLVEALVTAAGLDESEVSTIAVNITIMDSYRGKSSGLLSSSGGVMTVQGGRTGRDHTLDDVPHHYLRDRLMDYIHTQLPEEDREKVQKAVFDDLDETDLHAYAKFIKEDREREGKADQIYTKRGKGLTNKGEAKNILKQEQALEAIECDEMDLSVRWDEKRCPGEVGSYLAGSCLRPNQEPTKAETELRDSREVDWNCDEVRAMTARLVKYGNEGWILDSIRRALGSDERAELIEFLNGRGRRAGPPQIYGHLLDFFPTRQLLGIPLPSPSQKGEAGEGKKRKREPLEERAVNVIGKTLKEKQSRTKARKVAKDPYDGSIDYETYSKALAENDTTGPATADESGQSAAGA
ncbi:hypothetical protein LTR85_002798 [Meristemomyces frigidus]|nr:hypothetical protein LTR85_002798 [Meristemomyces frigidus]